jgi:large subunit ribosomal protein L19
MSSVIQDIERSQLRKGLPSFDAGDRVRVHFQVVEGARRRTQVFEGIVLRRQGSGARETFTVRKQSFGVGVERTFPLHSPKIEKLEIAARGDVRRAKLYYLRGRIGKAARVAERRWGIDEELISTPTAAAEPEAVDAEGVGQAEEDAAQTEAAEAAGPVAEEDSSSSQAAGEEPTSTPPAAEADEADAATPEEAKEPAPEVAEEPTAEASEEEEEAPEAEATEELAAEAEPEASSETALDTDAQAAEVGETEDDAAAQDAEDEEPAKEPGDSGGDPA